MFDKTCRFRSGGFLNKEIANQPVLSCFKEILGESMIVFININDRVRDTKASFTY